MVVWSLLTFSLGVIPMFTGSCVGRGVAIISKVRRTECQALYLFFQTFVDRLLLNWLNMLFMCKAIKQKEKKEYRCSVIYIAHGIVYFTILFTYFKNIFCVHCFVCECHTWILSHSHYIVLVHIWKEIKVTQTTHLQICIELK